ncbi:hypothetical protein FG386_002352 [Cryptosporidium ryanae]|uniref:uncharacterized protein n=1 Tax=Cryptosporidium ryanae TaxID=515981 RepID=UPI003519F335|nr:hypothetical protein FG386_002352 [Cryptosporidium ryanae]
MGLRHSRLNTNRKLILKIPHQNPVSSINYSGNTLYVGTYNGFIYKLKLNGRDYFEKCEFLVNPPYPIRYINVTSKENDSSLCKKNDNCFNEFSVLENNVNYEFKCKSEVELLLGASFKSKINSFKEQNSPIVPIMDDFSISQEAHCQITEVRSNIFVGEKNKSIRNYNTKDNSDSVGELKKSELRKDNLNESLPLFLISSVVNSYLGFSFKKENEICEEIALRPCNYFIPDKELVILDYDHVLNQLLIVERSPDRLDYYNLCSLQIFDLNSTEFGIKGGEISPLLNKPLKYLLNFPNKPHFLVNRNIISELTFNSSTEYKRTNNDKIQYKYNYSTVFLMSNFNKKKLLKYKSIYNVSNAKFWNQNSIIILISNHLIAKVSVSYITSNTGNCINNCDYITYSKNNFIVKSPDNNYTAVSTSNSDYLVALTEKSRLIIYSKKGEIIYNIYNIIPQRYQFKWVWPVNIFVSKSGHVVFNAFNGIYCVRCKILSSNHKTV